MASASTYFLDIFSNDSKAQQSGTPQIQLYKLLSGTYDVDAFEYLVEFIYTSRLEIKKDKVNAVYALANRLKISSVAYECGQFLASTLTPDSCLGVRAIPGVLADPMLLSAVDNYIRSSIGQVANSKTLEGLPKIKVEILHNNPEERAATNEKQLLAIVLDWIRKSFDSSTNMETLTAKIFMLYYSKSDKTLHDCDDIQHGDSNYSDVIQDYKQMSRKLAHGKLPANGIENGKNGDQHTAPVGLIMEGNGISSLPKPKQLFTRSDSDSSLSSIVDDDETDWKVLATHQALEAKNTIMGLVMVGGKLCVLTVKKRLHDPKRLCSYEVDGATVEDSLIPQDNAITFPTMSSARCAAGAACLMGKLFVCGKLQRGNCKSHTNFLLLQADMTVESA